MKTKTQTQTQYSTRQAAQQIGIGFRSLNRWLALGKIKPSTAIKMPDGRTLWLWSEQDITRGREVKATMKPGIKPGKPRKVKAKP